MSVPPGKRGTSAMQFIETADKIEKRAIEVCKRWPKTYTFLLTARTVELASKIYEEAQIANTVMPCTEQERAQRLGHLMEALGATYAFARKIERAYSLFPLCGSKERRSEQAEEEKSNRLLEEFMTLCLEEEEALKGNIHYTRNLKLKEPRPP